MKAMMVVAVMAGVLSFGSPSTAGAQSETLSWWALGDSYSSGEGIPGTEPPAPGKADCARATGKNTNAKAWAVVAKEALAEPRISSWAFTACTGAISSDVEGQMTEAAATSGTSRADIVTMSMGGNDILFPDVVYGCLDYEKSWSSLKPGCDVDETTMRRRIDMLVGDIPAEAGQYVGVTLPTVYDHIAAKVRPGGAVVILGYPQVIEEVGRWDWWRRNVAWNCEGIQDFDVAMLRSVAGYLNEQIALAVQAADQRWSSKGIRFHWQDIATGVYETGNDAEQRHALCSADPWLNGVTTGWTSGDHRTDRSFHPKQVGHTATGTWLASEALGQVIDRLDEARTPPATRLTTGQVAINFVRAIMEGGDARRWAYDNDAYNEGLAQLAPGEPPGGTYAYELVDECVTSHVTDTCDVMLRRPESEDEHSCSCSVFRVGVLFAEARVGAAPDAFDDIAALAEPKVVTIQGIAG